MSAQTTAQANFDRLSTNAYPGRGIVLGESPDGLSWVQVYWIMGRSENSRNRIFQANADGSVRTQAFDESKLTDPSLIIYHPARTWEGAHVITNGDQTDTIANALRAGGTFESALFTRAYEPDAPNFTPRISGITYPDGRYTLSILKTARNSEATGCLRQFFHYEKTEAGYGHLITTYATDGTPIPSFQGEPQLVLLSATADSVLEQYWNALNAENRVSLLVKFIDKKNGNVRTLIRNKLS